MTGWNRSSRHSPNVPKNECLIDASTRKVLLHCPILKQRPAGRVPDCMFVHVDISTRCARPLRRITLHRRITPPHQARLFRKARLRPRADLSSNDTAVSPNRCERSKSAPPKAGRLHGCLPNGGNESGRGTIADGPRHSSVGRQPASCSRKMRINITNRCIDD